MVGMPRTPYLVGTCGFSSMLSLAMVTLSPSSAESSSRAGAIMRQGPHHSAQKSTRTGFLASRTSAWNEASDTLRGMDVILGNDGSTISRNAPPQGQDWSRLAGHETLGYPRHLHVQNHIGKL